MFEALWSNGSTCSNIGGPAVSSQWLSGIKGPNPESLIHGVNEMLMLFPLPEILNESSLLLFITFPFT